MVGAAEPTGRAHILRSARRCAASRHEPADAQSASPLLSWPGRSRCSEFSWSGARNRVYGDDSLEIFNDDLRGAPPRQSAHDAMRSLLFVEEQVRRAMRSKEADAHLERVDHIAQALPEGRLDGWVLFYRTLLGLEPEGVVDLPDPTV